MKKHTISILAIAGCIGILQSCAFRPCTTMSLNLGGVHSRIVGEDNSWNGAFGGQVGASFQVPYEFSVPVSIWGELNLSMEGAGWENDFGTLSESGITRLIYLNVPLTGRYHFGNGFYGEAGVQPGFLLSAKDKFEGDSFDYKEYIKKFNFSIPLGVGKKFENNFGLEFRVIPGITNINAGDYEGYTDRNLSFALRGTYTFPRKD